MNWTFDSRDFHYWKKMETMLLSQAFSTICITQQYVKSYRHCVSDFKFDIIPNNVNTSVFANKIICSKSKLRDKFGLSSYKRIYLYLGDISLNGWHKTQSYRKFYDNVVKNDDRSILVFAVPDHSNVLIFKPLISIMRY